MFLQLDASLVLYRQIYEKIRTSVLHGGLTAGQRLPSTRTLALDLGVSRRTVLLAYQELLSEGFIVGRVGGGTYVAPELPDVSFFPTPTKLARSRRRVPIPRLSKMGRRISDEVGIASPSWTLSRQAIRYDFNYGQPAVDWFPSDTWRRLLNRHLKKPSVDLLGFAPPEGYSSLREAVATYLSHARGVSCTRDQIIIVGGSQQAIDLIARMLLDPGDRVAIEEPHYQAARQIFLAAGAKLLPIPVDSDGLVVSDLKARGRGVRLVYTTPSHQFPTGMIMPLARRLALLKWAEQENAYVLEDDYDSEFRYTGRPVAAIQGLDRGGRVIYVGTFSKVLFPALRVGYIVVPQNLVPLFTAAKFLSTGYAPTLEQRVLADFLHEGSFERHLRRSRTGAAAKRNAMLNALKEYIGDRIVVSGADAGLHMLVWFRDISRSQVSNLAKRAAKRGVGIYSVAPYYLRPPRRGGLLLGYASMPEEDIREGIRSLAEVL